MADWADRAVTAIWRDLCDRQGFGLECLESDDPEVWAQIQVEHAQIIRKAAEEE